MRDSPDPELERIRQRKIKELKREMSQSRPDSAQTQMPQGTLHLTSQDFDQVINQGVTLVDFSTEWCGPCKMMAPIIQKLAQEFAGRAKVAKVDVDTNMELAMRYQIRGVPTFGIFKNGKLIQRIVGGVGYQPLKIALSQAL